MMHVWVGCLLLGAQVAESHFNGALQFLVGNAPNGAVRVTGESPLDLEKACDRKRCPSVVIFTGNQYGTVELSNCYVGQLYFFINKSQSDLGVVVQQRGGLYGAKPIAQYAIGNCFCYPRGPEEEARERRLADLHDTGSTNSAKVEDGLLLCG